MSEQCSPRNPCRRVTGPEWTEDQCRWCWRKRHPHSAANPPAWRLLPGSQLEMLFAELGVKMKEGCGCDEIKQAMNNLGVAGCRLHEAELVAQLEARSAAYTFSETALAAWHALAGGLPWSLAGMFREAVNRSERAQVAASSSAALLASTA